MHIELAELAEHGSMPLPFQQTAQESVPFFLIFLVLSLLIIIFIFLTFTISFFEFGVLFEASNFPFESTMELLSDTKSSA